MYYIFHFKDGYYYNNPLQMNSAQRVCNVGLGPVHSIRGLAGKRFDARDSSQLNVMQAI